MENENMNNVENTTQTVEVTEKNNKNGWKIAFFVLLVLAVTGIVAALVVPSLIKKEDKKEEPKQEEQKKEEPKEEEPVDQPEPLTKDSQVVKDLFETYKVIKQDASIVTILKSDDEEDDYYYVDAKKDVDYISEEIRLFYAIVNSYEKDKIACSSLKYKSSAYKSCFANKNDTSTKTRYAKLENVKAKFKELYNEELKDDLYDELEWWDIPIDYSKNDKMFVALNYLHTDEGRWSYSVLCSEEFKDIETSNGFLDIHSNLVIGLNKCNTKEDYKNELVYRFKYDSNTKKYVLNYIYFTYK